MNKRAGSSPRVWGTVLEPATTRVAARFIPTCVGNGWLSWLACLAAAVHPHVCGERADIIAVGRNRSGSSPRVWGTAGVRVGLRQMWRFIPTCVGNGSRAITTITARSVHPHVCGERIARSARLGVDCGSSPRVWGTALMWRYA